ncbi:sulfurtransferase [Mesorhizobium sp. DCY119]|nr:sulfurtransferase [Mesorhizobium sp. DCY119]
MNERPPLVTVEWLRENRDDPSLVLLDASVWLDRAPEGQIRGEFRSGLDQYITSGHIPGARFADLFTEFSDAEAAHPFTLPRREQFEAAAGRLGITPESHVVIYDAIKGQWAARLWWVFRTLGHGRVSVLDGGLRRYRALGGTLETGIAPYPRTTYRNKGTPGPYASRADVLDLVARRTEGTLICLLQPDDFAGIISVRSRAGHIPGSVNLPFDTLIDEKDNTLLPAEELRSRFRAVTPLEGERVITYCGGGIASTLGALSLAVIGYGNTLEYDGSLADWLSDPELPLVTGR